MVTEQDVKELAAWCRKIEFYDQDEDGIGEITASYKIRDEEDRMWRIYESMTHVDACAILKDLVLTVASPCDGFEDDWRNHDSGFHAGFDWDRERGEIVLTANFRT